MNKKADIGLGVIIGLVVTVILFFGLLALQWYFSSATDNKGFEIEVRSVSVSQNSLLRDILKEEQNGVSIQEQLLSAKLSGRYQQVTSAIDQLLEARFKKNIDFALYVDNKRVQDPFLFATTKDFSTIVLGRDGEPVVITLKISNKDLKEMIS